MCIVKLPGKKKYWTQIDRDIERPHDRIKTNWNDTKRRNWYVIRINLDSGLFYFSLKQKGIAKRRFVGNKGCLKVMLEKPVTQNRSKWKRELLKVRSSNYRERIALGPRLVINHKLYTSLYVSIHSVSTHVSAIVEILFSKQNKTFFFAFQLNKKQQMNMCVYTKWSVIFDALGK